MKPAMISTFFSIICFFIVSFSRPAGSQESSIEKGTSKSFADKTTRTGLAMANKIKFEVLKVTEDLLRYRERIFKRMLAKMADHHKGTMNLVRSGQKDTLKRLENMVTAMRKEDPSINECYISTQNRIRQQIEDLERNNCSEIDMERFNEFIAQIDQTKTLGDRIIDFLDDVIFHCCSKDSVLFRQCVVSKSNSVKEYVNIYQHDFKILRPIGLEMVDNPRNFQCFGQRVAGILVGGIQSIYNDGVQCIMTDRNADATDRQRLKATKSRKK